MSLQDVFFEPLKRIYLMLDQWIMVRKTEVERKTNETEIRIKLKISGAGKHDIIKESTCRKSIQFRAESFTPTLQKSRIPQIRGIKGEAVALYREPLITKEMRDYRLSRRVKNT